MLKLTLRGILRHKIRLVSTFVAIVLGVGFMAGTLVLGDTVTKSFDDVFADVYARVDTVVRSDEKIETAFGPERQRISEDVVPDVRRVDGVAAAEGQVAGVVRIIGKDGKPLGNPQGGPPTFGLNWFTTPELNGWTVADGRPPEGPGEVVLDVRSATDGGFAVGDEVRVGLQSGTVAYTMVGTARFGQLDNYAGAPAVLFETAEAQQAAGEPGKFDWISVAGDDGVTQADLTARVAAVLPPGNEALTGQAFTEENQELFGQFIQIFTVFLFAFGVIAMFVGAFIIYNTFTIIVTQRTQELALLRALGAGRAQVLRSVLVEALAIGVVATAVGLAFGVAVAQGLRELLGAAGVELLPAPLVVAPSRFVVPVLVSLVITMVAAAVPAWRATRVAPIAALRSVAVDTTTHTVARVVVAVVFLGISAWLLVTGLSIEDDLAVAYALGASVPAFVAAFVLGPLYAPALAQILGAPLQAATGGTGRLARENARRNPTRTATTAISLTIGVGLISIIAVAGASLTRSVDAAIDAGVTADYIVQADSFLGMPPAIADDLAAVDGVAEVAAVRFGPAEVDGDGTFLVASDLPALAQMVDLDVVEGSPDAVTGDGIAVTNEEATANGWTIGSAVPATFSLTGDQTFRVALIYRSGIFAGQNGRGFIIDQATFDANQAEVAQVDQRAFVKLDPGVSVESIRPALEEVMTAYPTAKLLDLDEFRGEAASRIQQSLAFIYALLALAVVIGVIGVVNTLLLSVFERTREIGLIRAVGGKRGQVRSMVLQESVIIAVLGTVIGLAVGLFFGWAMSQTFTGDLEVLYTVPVLQLVFIIGLAAVGGVLAGALPARRAARLDVLDAISTE